MSTDDERKANRERRQEFHTSMAINIVKRLKKAELVPYIARMTMEHEEKLEEARAELHTAIDYRDGFKREITSLARVRDVVRVLVERDAKLKGLLNPQQLTMALHKDRDDLGDNAVEKSLGKLLDNIDKFLEEFGGGHGAPSYDDVANALDSALSDRDALLEKLRLTDREWSMLGGYSHTDVEV